LVTPTLTPRQREVFVAIVLDDVPPDALVLSLSSSRNAICKLLLTPRVSSGPPLLLAGICPMTLRGAHERLAGTGRFLRTDLRDVGCAAAAQVLHIYAELVAAGVPAEQRYPGLAAHLQACGPCGEDFEGLLAAVRGEAP